MRAFREHTSECADPVPKYVDLDVDVRPVARSNICQTAVFVDDCVAYTIFNGCGEGPLVCLAGFGDLGTVDGHRYAFASYVVGFVAVR